MNYKIVSQNQKLIQKLKYIFNTLGYKESIHIQEVDLWLVDTKTITNDSLLSYKNKDTYSHILFIKNSYEDISLLLKNSFTHYIDKDFNEQELLAWCSYYFKEKKDHLLKIDKHITIDFLEKHIIIDSKKISLSAQEIKLLKELSSFQYISTQHLTNNLNLTSTSSIRSLINRLKKKLSYNIFEQNRSYGYKLIHKKTKEKQETNLSHIKELEEQNNLMQNIIDSSPIFIVTFIHKQLYCINKSFREYLGINIIKELWDEENGDFFQLIDHNPKELNALKQKLFSKGEHKIKLYETNHNKTAFIIKTFYFENLDKHLFVFKPL